MKVNNPKYLIAARQTVARSGVSNKAIKVSVFDRVDVRKNHIQIVEIRFPKDSANIIYGTNDYLDQNRDLKLFYDEYGKNHNLNSL